MGAVGCTVELAKGLGWGLFLPVGERRKAVGSKEWAVGNFRR